MFDRQRVLFRLVERWFIGQQHIGGAAEDTVSDHEARLRMIESGRPLPRRPARARRRLKTPDHELWYLVEWYHQIRAGMDADLSYKPISSQEIVGFRDLYRLDVDAFDADTLRRLDVLWLKSRPKKG